jgi:hypothetical protein
MNIVRIYEFDVKPQADLKNIVLPEGETWEIPHGLDPKEWCWFPTTWELCRRSEVNLFPRRAA